MAAEVLRRRDRESSRRPEELELEVRFPRLPVAVFGAAFRGFLGSRAAPALAHSVTASLPDGDGRRREAAPGGSSHYIRKTRVKQHYHRAVHGPDYRLVLSREEPVPPFSVGAAALVRVRARASFPVGRWRYDFTVSQQISGSRAAIGLRAVADRLWKDSPQGLLELLPAPGADRHGADGRLYEIEIELAGPGPVTPDEVEAAVARLLAHSHPEHLERLTLQRELHRVASLVHQAPGLARRFSRRGGLRHLVPQVVALSRVSYQALFPPAGYYLTDKAHGVRALASLHDGRLYLLGDRATLVPLRPAAAPAAAAPAAGGPTVLDGELIAAPPAKPRFYAFDVVALRGENLAALPFEQRVLRLPAAVAALRPYDLQAEAKPYETLDPATLQGQFQAMHGREAPYETDGLILVEPGRSYLATRSHKWKPASHNTIDFLLRLDPAADPPGADSGTPMQLFVGVNPDLFRRFRLRQAPGYGQLFPPSSRQSGYFPVQFQPASNPEAYRYSHPPAPPAAGGWAPGDWPAAADLDGKVAEMVWLAEPGRWQLLRVRTDRQADVEAGGYYGNDFRVAELTWLNYGDPLSLEALWTGPGGQTYFRAAKSEAYAGPTAFTSYVKSQLVKPLARASWVVDLGSGKGQDLWRYLRAGVENLAMVDQDSSALAELVSRRYSNRHRPAGATALHVLRSDILDPGLAARLRALPGFPGAGCEAVVCNLAVHYLLKNGAALAGFADLCRGLLRPGGRLVLTCMLGRRVHALLAGVAPGETWEGREKGRLKYGLRRDYRSDGLTEAGQAVGVLLPFSAGAFYTEYLVNVEALRQALQRRGLRLLKQLGFEEYAAGFRKGNATLHDQLSPADNQWLSLYGTLVWALKK